MTTFPTKIRKIPTTPALLLGIIAIATLAFFPPSAQALPKNCGKTFTLDGEKHCVKIETASDICPKTNELLSGKFQQNKSDRIFRNREKQFG